ncbi:MAG: TIGR01212 family radical SAM protein [Oscillospiraceae bacterium]|nr:TIGR01212 family radical SAM protein [Oscillospiraceae bacterium]
MYYNSLNDKLRLEFGEKLYKLSLSGGMTCPNRDGKIDTRGCIFCSEKGSGDFAEPFCEDIFSQIERAKSQVSKKFKGNKYIAYFQSFTNTYAPPEYLEALFLKTASHPDISIISVATRPDCLDSEILKVLEKISKIKPLWVELGLQTANEETSEYIRRGYKNAVYEKAVANLHSIGVEVITHIILGLPFESEADMINSVRYVSKHKSDGIKLQLLHILKGTDLALDYKNGLFSPLNLEEYIDILCKCVENLSRDITIHRLTGDGDKKTLIAPLWSTDKKSVLNAITKAFRERDIVQGRLYK